MRFILLYCIIFYLFTGTSFSQNVGINATGTAPNNSAMLDVASTDKGFLMPRMTAAQRLAITTPANSLMVFDTDSNAIFMYKQPVNRWERINPTYNLNNFIMGNAAGDILVWNGSVWEARPSCNLFTYLYKDNDGDGFGDRCEPLLACGTTFPCYVSSNTDNNDSDPTIYPGAPELCDNKDNDQDGQIDELPIAGVGLSCSTGQFGRCATGTTQCVSGSIICVRNLNPIAELCNNIDDDCDGTIDEDFPLKGTSCVAGTGACARTGTWICNASGTGLVCSATPGTPTAEICDNIDNDCDGAIDEGLTRSCYSGPAGTANVGRCRTGMQNCSAGLWGTCVGQVLPIPEIIGNGIDDNCDGIVQ